MFLYLSFLLFLDGAFCFFIIIIIIILIIIIIIIIIIIVIIIIMKLLSQLLQLLYAGNLLNIKLRPVTLDIQRIPQSPGSS